jgi:hypothetical protein
MAQTSWPFENIDTSETQFSQWARHIGEGVRPGYSSELEVTADSTGMNVKVLAGQALVRGHYYDSTATETLTIATADLTNPRIDTVVLRLDPTANTVSLVVLTGTPAASPSAPALTQTEGSVYELPLANVAVSVAETVIAPGDLTDRRVYIAQASGFTANRALVSDANGNIIASTTIDTTELGYLNGVTSSIQTQLNGKAPLAQTVSDKSANYTIIAGDNGNIIRLTGATGRTFTINNVLSIGQRIDFLQDGTGQITFLAGAGVTLRSVDSNLKTKKQYSGATVICVASGVYHLIGDLAA